MNRLEAFSPPNFLQSAVQTLTISRTENYKIKIPFSACLGIILLAFGALCVTAGLRTHNEMCRASELNNTLRQEVLIHQRENQQIVREIKGLATSPQIIEQAARKMGLVKRNEVVVIFPKTSN